MISEFITPQTREDDWLRLMRITAGSGSLALVKANFWGVLDLYTTQKEMEQSVSQYKVLVQDVKRTRSDEKFFCNNNIRRVMKNALLCFCAYYRLEYMQGLNEILAPLLAISMVAIPGRYAIQNSRDGDGDSDSSPKVSVSTSASPSLSPSSSSLQRSNKSRSEDSEDSEESDVAYADAGDSDDESGHARQYRQKGHSYVYSISGAEGAWEEGHTSRTHMVPELHHLRIQYNLSFVFLERLVLSLQPLLYQKEGIFALQAQLASLHSLLFYFDAPLAGYLSRHGMRCEIYAQSWLITLFTRRTPIPLSLYLLDRLLLLTAPPAASANNNVPDAEQFSGRPYVLVLLALVLVLQNRERILTVPQEELPQLLSILQFKDEAAVDAAVARLSHVHSLAPPALLRDVQCTGFSPAISSSSSTSQAGAYNTYNTQRAALLEEIIFRPCAVQRAVDMGTAVMGAEGVYLQEVTAEGAFSEGKEKEKGKEKGEDEGGYFSVADAVAVSGDEGEWGDGGSGGCEELPDFGLDWEGLNKEHLLLDLRACACGDRWAVRAQNKPLGAIGESGGKRSASATSSFGTSPPASGPQRAEGRPNIPTVNNDKVNMLDERFDPYRLLCFDGSVPVSAKAVAEIGSAAAAKQQRERERERGEQFKGVVGGSGGPNPEEGEKNQGKKNINSYVRHFSKSTATLFRFLVASAREGTHIVLLDSDADYHFSPEDAGARAMEEQEQEKEKEKEKSLYFNNSGSGGGNIKGEKEIKERKEKEWKEREEQKKKRERARACLRASHRLATALLVLGFSRVSLMGGKSLSSIDSQAQGDFYRDGELDMGGLPPPLAPPFGANGGSFVPGSISDMGSPHNTASNQASHSSNGSNSSVLSENAALLEEGELDEAVRTGVLRVDLDPAVQRLMLQWGILNTSNNASNGNTSNTSNTSNMSFTEYRSPPKQGHPNRSPLSSRTDGFFCLCYELLVRRMARLKLRSNVGESLKTGTDTDTDTGTGSGSGGGVEVGGAVPNRNITPYVICTNQPLPFLRRTRRLRDLYLRALDLESPHGPGQQKSQQSQSVSPVSGTALGSNTNNNQPLNRIHRTPVDGVRNATQSQQEGGTYAEVGSQALWDRTLGAAGELYGAILGQSNDLQGGLQEAVPVADKEKGKKGGKSESDRGGGISAGGAVSASTYTPTTAPRTPSTPGTAITHMDDTPCTPGGSEEERERLQRFIQLSHSAKQQQLALAHVREAATPASTGKGRGQDKRMASKASHLDHSIDLDSHGLSSSKQQQHHQQQQQQQQLRELKALSVDSKSLRQIRARVEVLVSHIQMAQFHTAEVGSQMRAVDKQWRLQEEEEKEEKEGKGKGKGKLRKEMEEF